MVSPLVPRAPRPRETNATNFATIHRRHDMTRHHRNGCLALVLGLTFLLTAAPLWGEASPEAKPWIEKLISIYEGGPFETSYVANLDLQQGGQSVEGVVDGQITWGDRQHMRVEMTIRMTGMLPGAGDQATEMEVLSVTDGELTWTDVAIPAMNVHQVMKISIEQAKAMAESGAMGANPAAMDPVQQLESLAKNVDFVLDKIEDGKVHLSATVGPENKSQLGQLGSMPGADHMALVLHEKTGHPAAITIGGERPVVTMEFGEFSSTTMADLPEGTFTYNPPEGIPVMDLGGIAHPTR